MWAEGQHGVCAAVFLSVSCLPTADFLWCFSSGGFCTVHLKFTRRRKGQSYNFLLFVASSVAWTDPEGKGPVVSRIIPKSCCQHVKEKSSYRKRFPNKRARDNGIKGAKSARVRTQESLINRGEQRENKDSLVLTSWTPLPVPVSSNNPRASFFSHQPRGNPFYLSQMEGQSL